MRKIYKKYRARFWRLFRRPVFLGPTSLGWPSPLVEGDYYRSITGKFYEIKDGFWQVKP